MSDGSDDEDDATRFSRSVSLELTLDSLQESVVKRAARSSRLLL